MSRESVRTDAAHIAEAVQKALADYGENVTAQLPDIVAEAAKECKAEIVATAPRKTGEYARGWAIKNGNKSPTSTSKIVYNRTRYRLTHLLENGHAKVNGGRVEGRPHIAPAAEHAADNLVKKMKEAAKNA